MWLVTTRQHFGFQNAAGARPFSLNKDGGGVWYRKRDPLADSGLLSDADFRVLIKSRILRNYQTATVTDLVRACEYLIGDGVTVTDNLDMTVTITIPENLVTQFIRFELEKADLLPRQAGVKYNIIYQ
ncbi:DUF2612 domain-containing protein [Mergibacter septicus]|uniref:DUF2612 domain-containing protein n=1 Tax=Mergibacter septicus TaxID=221402 RepID=UPI00223EEEB8|nr:DUF2612 domain-containing protein [Mergibacter septicus]